MREGTLTLSGSSSVMMKMAKNRTNRNYSYSTYQASNVARAGREDFVKPRHAAALALVGWHLLPVYVPNSVEGQASASIAGVSTVYLGFLNRSRISALHLIRYRLHSHLQLVPLNISTGELSDWTRAIAICFLGGKATIGTAYPPVTFCQVKHYALHLIAGHSDSTGRRARSLPSSAYTGI
jgi:hypothetical protein